VKPAPPPKPIMLSDLPAACREVLIGAPPGERPDAVLAASRPASVPVPQAAVGAPDEIENPSDQTPTGLLQ